MTSTNPFGCRYFIKVKQKFVILWYQWFLVFESQTLTLFNFKDFESQTITHNSEPMSNSNFDACHLEMSIYPRIQKGQLLTANNKNFKKSFIH